MSKNKISPLREWRLRNGLTQVELAEKLGITAETLCREEMGTRRLKVRSARLLVKALTGVEI